MQKPRLGNPRRRARRLAERVNVEQRQGGLRLRSQRLEQGLLVLLLPLRRLRRKTITTTTLLPPSTRAPSGPGLAVLVHRCLRVRSVAVGIFFGHRRKRVATAVARGGGGAESFGAAGTPEREEMRRPWRHIVYYDSKNITATVVDVGARGRVEQGRRSGSAAAAAAASADGDYRGGRHCPCVLLRMARGRPAAVAGMCEGVDRHAGGGGWLIFAAAVGAAEAVSLLLWQRLLTGKSAFLLCRLCVFEFCVVPVHHNKKRHTERQTKKQIESHAVRVLGARVF